MWHDERPTADDLDRAADLLERDGWRRGAYGPTHAQNVHAPRCVVGALAAVRGSWNTMDLTHAVERELGLPLHRGQLAGWNDHHARDKRQVVRALRRTARKLRGASR